MNVTNEPALGIDRENSDIVFPVARMATPATRNAHGACDPIAATTSVRDRKIPSTGARLASVDDKVSNRLSAPRASRACSTPDVVPGSSMVAIARPPSGLIRIMGLYALTHHDQSAMAASGRGGPRACSPQPRAARGPAGRLRPGCGGDGA